MKKGRNSDSLDLLAAQFYEDARDAWPLVTDPFASPTPREKPLPSSANPFQRPRRPPRPMKHSYLTSRDAEKVYDAMAYAMWKDGVILNTHVIIVWSMMG